MCLLYITYISAVFTYILCISLDLAPGMHLIMSSMLRRAVEMRCTSRWQSPSRTSSKGTRRLSSTYSPWHGGEARFGYPDDEVLSLVSAADAKKQVLKKKAS